MMLSSKKLLVALLLIVSSLCLFLSWKLYDINNQTIEIAPGSYGTVYKQLGQISFVIDQEGNVIVWRQLTLFIHGTLIKDENGFKILTDTNEFINIITYKNQLLLPIEWTLNNMTYQSVLKIKKFSNMPYSQEGLERGPLQLP